MEFSAVCSASDRIARRHSCFHGKGVSCSSDEASDRSSSASLPLSPPSPGVLLLRKSRGTSGESWEEGSERCGIRVSMGGARQTQCFVGSSRDGGTAPGKGLGLQHGTSRNLWCESEDEMPGPRRRWQRWVAPWCVVCVCVSLPDSGDFGGSAFGDGCAFQGIMVTQT